MNVVVLDDKTTCCCSIFNNKSEQNRDDTIMFPDHTPPFSNAEESQHTRSCVSF